MSMSNETKDDGWFAFPHPHEDNANGAVISYGTPGMTLRDYFAAKALLGLMFDTNGENTMITPTAQASPSELATMSYQIADAMIAARQVFIAQSRTPDEQS